jgi:hypothetical protein
MSPRHAPKNTHPGTKFTQELSLHNLTLPDSGLWVAIIRASLCQARLGSQENLSSTLKHVSILTIFKWEKPAAANNGPARDALVQPRLPELHSPAVGLSPRLLSFPKKSGSCRDSSAPGTAWG